MGGAPHGIFNEGSVRPLFVERFHVYRMSRERQNAQTNKRYKLHSFSPWPDLVLSVSYEKTINTQAARSVFDA